MADTEFDYDVLPPLVPKGADRAQIIAEIVEKWCAKPTEISVYHGGIDPAYTLTNYALVDANIGESGDPIDLRDLIFEVQTELDRRNLSEDEKRKRIISLDHCRIDACQCPGLQIIPELRVFVCRFGNRVNFENTAFGHRAGFESATFGERADFSKATFGERADFMYATFGEKANFSKATFGERANFMSATFGEKANFSKATFGERADFWSATFGERADFSKATFGERADFRSATFGERADFWSATFGERANFMSATFGIGVNFRLATFIQSDFRHCQLANFNVRGTVLTRCRGLYGRDRAKVGAVVDAEWADYRHRFKFNWFPPWIDVMHWARLSSIGTLRLFAASYTAFILITALVISARWWNGHVTGWQDWAESKRIEEGIALPLWLDLVEKIPYISKPAHFGWQLIMLGILALGATIYTAACPEPIKEASETRWTRELDQPVIEYRAAMYSRFWLRHLCFACYAVGGGYTLYYIAWKGITAIRYLLE